MITKKQFDILKNLSISSGSLTQRDLSYMTGYSLGTINSCIKLFLEKRWIGSDYKLLFDGRRILNQFKVKNAIILAAGVTRDKNSVTSNIPKALYRVKGEILIERLINQLQEKQIKDIYVVVGFKMEQLFYLESKYGVKIIVNPEYLTRNNNGSLYYAQNYLGNSYVIPCDEYFTENVFSEYEYDSFYASVYSKTRTKEAFVDLSKDGRILRVYKGGNSGWTMVGHSYLRDDFCRKYIRWLNESYPLYETKNKFWEEIFYPHLKDTPIYVKKYKDNVISEFDQLNEMNQFDSEFINNINPLIFNFICEVFNCSTSEITDIQAVDSDSSDIIFSFHIRNDIFMFRYPTDKTIKLNNFGIESAKYEIAGRFGFIPNYVTENVKGYRISLQDEQVKADKKDGIAVLKKLQSSNIPPITDFDYKYQIKKLNEILDNDQKHRLFTYEKLQKQIFNLLEKIEADKWEKHFSNNSITEVSFRKFNDSIFLSQWDNAGVNDIGYDIADLALAFSDNDSLDRTTISEFVPLTNENIRHLIACCAVSNYYRFMLGIYESDSENYFSNNIYIFWKRATYFAREAELLYSEQINPYISNEQMAFVEKAIGERIQKLIPLKGGTTNSTYKLISSSGRHYSLRIPGIGTNDYISRSDEMRNINEMDDLGIMPKVKCADPKTGILILDFLDGCRPCSIEDVHDQKRLRMICDILNSVHSSGKTFLNEFNIPKMQKMYKKHFLEIGGDVPPEVQEEETRMDQWMNYLFENYPKELVTCHIDPKLNNFLDKNEKLYLIDWEYSGMADRYFELANFTLTNNLNEEEENLFTTCYSEISGIHFIKEKYLLYLFATDYLWIYWHLIKCQQNVMVDYNEMSWKKRLRRARNVLKRIESLKG